MILMQLAVGWFDQPTMLNQSAALVLCNLSFVFLQGCAIFVCWAFIDFKLFISKSEYTVETYKQGRWAARLPRSHHQQPTCSVTPILFVKIVPEIFVYVIVFRRFSQNFEKLLLASSRLSVCLSVCLTARIEQLGCLQTDFQEILRMIFRKSVGKM